MILEMPDLSDDDPFISWERIDKYINQEHLKLKLMTATHVHGDHFNTYPQFNKKFPNIPIIVNPLFFREVTISNFITPRDIWHSHSLKPSYFLKDIPIYCFEGKSFETDLSGEPLYLLRAPKHSWSDTLILFRGTVITGDWWLGPGDPNPNRIPIGTINRSIDFLESFIKEKQYHIHTLISVHANEYRRGIDFIEIMEQTRP